MQSRLIVPMLKTPIQYLLLGLVLGGTAVAIGYIASQYLSNNVETLISECKADHLKPVSASTPEWAKDPLVCELRELEPSAVAQGNSLVGVQARIVETHVLSQAWLHRSRLAGALIFCVLALPYFWYFLLRRISELRRAIVGR